MVPTARRPPVSGHARPRASRHRRRKTYPRARPAYPYRRAWARRSRRRPQFGSLPYRLSFLNRLPRPRSGRPRQYRGCAPPGASCRACLRLSSGGRPWVWGYSASPTSPAANPSSTLSSARLFSSSSIPSSPPVVFQRPLDPTLPLRGLVKAFSPENAVTGFPA